jgi:hypothetical protein
MPENYTIMEVFDRCGDEWITRGGDGAIMALPGASIREALDISDITDIEHRQRIFDKVKTVSRAIVKEAGIERERQQRTRGSE